MSKQQKITFNCIMGECFFLCGGTLLLERLQDHPPISRASSLVTHSRGRELSLLVLEHHHKTATGTSLLVFLFGQNLAGTS